MPGDAALLTAGRPFELRAPRGVDVFRVTLQGESLAGELLESRPEDRVGPGEAGADSTQGAGCGDGRSDMLFHWAAVGALLGLGEFRRQAPAR